MPEIFDFLFIMFFKEVTLFTKNHCALHARTHFNVFRYSQPHNTLHEWWKEKSIRHKYLI